MSYDEHQFCLRNGLINNNNNNIIVFKSLGKEKHYIFCERQTKKY